MITDNLLIPQNPKVYCRDNCAYDLIPFLSILEYNRFFFFFFNCTFSVLALILDIGLFHNMGIVGIKLFFSTTGQNISSMDKFRIELVSVCLSCECARGGILQLKWLVDPVRVNWQELLEPVKDFVAVGKVFERWHSAPVCYTFWRMRQYIRRTMWNHCLSKLSFYLFIWLRKLASDKKGLSNTWTKLRCKISWCQSLLWDKQL